MLISEIYHENPKTISPDASIKEALDILISDRVNALIVTTDKERVLGVLSLQDIAAATVPRQFRNNVQMAAAMYKKGFFSQMCQSIKDKPVKSLMRKNFVSVQLNDNIMAVTADFLFNDLYVVPVIEHKKLIGVVARSEIKRALKYGMRDNYQPED